MCITSLAKQTLFLTACSMPVSLQLPYLGSTTVALPLIRRIPRRFGTSLHVPTPSSFKSRCIHPCHLIPHSMGNLYPTHCTTYIASTGFDCVHQDAYLGPLQHPCNGPFKILETAGKHFIFDVYGHQDAVSIDSLKIAYGRKDLPAPSTMSQLHPVPPLWTLGHHFLHQASVDPSRFHIAFAST